MPELKPCPFDKSCKNFILKDGGIDEPELLRVWGCPHANGMRLDDWNTRQNNGTKEELDEDKLTNLIISNWSMMSDSSFASTLSKLIYSHFSKPNGKLSVSMSSDKIGLCSVEYGKPLEDEGQKREVVMPSKITLEEIIDEVSHNTIPENDVVLISQSILSHLQEINGVKE